MDNKLNYYRILHVQPDAPEEVIKASYRALMQKLKIHPDLGGSHWNAVLVNQAYDALTNPAKRKKYDEGLLQDVLDSIPRLKMDVPNELTPADPPPAFQQQYISNYCLFCKTPYHPEHEYALSVDCFECGSPLPSEASSEVSAENKRLIERKSVHDTLTYYLYWPEPPSQATIHDLSPKGVSFIVHEDLPPNSIIKLNSKLFRAVGEVTRCELVVSGNLCTYFVGVEFLSVIFNTAVGGFLSIDV